MVFAESLDQLFIEPVSKDVLRIGEDGQALATSSHRFAIANHTIDFDSPEAISDAAAVETEGFTASTSPELREAHDAAFAEAASTGDEIYGSLDDMPLVRRTGHFRRMEILQGIPLGEISQSVVVDFGTGPWGFAAIYPALKNGRLCIGFDVSAVACKSAVSVTDERDLERTIYATSDGEVIPLADDSVDVFFGGEVIEHVRNPRVFMQEIARVCREGAQVVLTTPNRDALSYLISGEPYATGPEHTALMSVPEFRDVLRLFTTEISLWGYETSLAPKLDEVLTDTELADAVQRRSFEFPELATGVISHSRVSKALYRQNQSDWELTELTWASDEVEVTGSSQQMHLFANVQGLLLEDGTSVTIPCRGDGPILMFWGHDWSGNVEITRGSEVFVKDLFLSEAGYARVELPALPRSNSAPIVIRKAGSKGDRSHSDQVIFCKLLDYTEGEPLAT